MVEFGVIFVGETCDSGLYGPNDAAEVGPGDHHCLDIVLRRNDSSHTANRSHQEYSSKRWKPCTKNTTPVAHRKNARKIPLNGRVGGFSGGGSLNLLLSVSLRRCCSSSFSLSSYYSCIEI